MVFSWSSYFSNYSSGLRALNFFSITFCLIILSSVCSSRSSSMAYSFCSWMFSSCLRQSSKIFFISGSRFWRFWSSFFFIKLLDYLLLFEKMLHILDWLLSLTVRSWCWFNSVMRLTISWMSSSSWACSTFSVVPSAVAAVLSITLLKASEKREAIPPPVVVFDLPPEWEDWAPNPILLWPYDGP